MTDLEQALLLASIDMAGAALDVERSRRARAARMVAASALAPERGCSCGRALVLPGHPLCDLCEREEQSAGTQEGRGRRIPATHAVKNQRRRRLAG